jgi:imidazolonepropionase-like amidohydrolase
LLVPSADLFAEDPKPAPEEKESDEADDVKKGEEAEEEEEEEKPEDRYFAVTGAVIHTITDGDRYGATILAKNGKIAEIGWSVDLPEDAEVLDATGYHLYPGLIAAGSRGILGAKPADDTTDVYSIQMSLALAGGITTAVSNNSAVSLTFGSTDDMVIKRNVFENLTYSTRDPDGRRKLRADFEKVRQYIRDLEAYQEKKKTDPDAEEPDKEWLKGDYEKYYKLIRREAVAVSSADDAYEILQLCDLARDYGISIVIRGATEAWTVPLQMARAGVSAIVSPRPGLFTQDFGHDERLNRPTGRSIENAAILHGHGVPVAILPTMANISFFGVTGRDLLHLPMEAAFAVRGGMPEDAALRAITIDAAQILGIDHRVGSIEVGKDANFSIWDGDPLYYMSMVRWTVVNGHLVYDKQEDSLFDHIRPDGDRDAPPPDDYWPRRLGADQ